MSSGVVGNIVSAVAGNTGTGGSAAATTGGSGGSTSSGVGFYRSHSRSPCRFETPEPRYESRTREPFTLASVVHRDLYREDRGRRGERSYRHSRSRSPHSTHSRNPSPQRLASQAARPPRSHSGSGSRSRSSSSDSVSSTSSSTSGRWVKLIWSAKIFTLVLCCCLPLCIPVQKHPRADAGQSHLKQKSAHWTLLQIVVRFTSQNWTVLA